MASDIYKENYEMRKQIEEMRKDFSDIITNIYCVGGPLNDNILGYTNKQLLVFSRISEIAKRWGD